MSDLSDSHFLARQTLLALCWVFTIALGIYISSAVPGPVQRVAYPSAQLERRVTSPAPSLSVPAPVEPPKALPSEIGAGKALTPPVASLMPLAPTPRTAIKKPALIRVRLSSPRDAEVIYDHEGKAMIDFRWSLPNGASRQGLTYLLELSSSVSMGDPIVRRRAKAPRVSDLALELSEGQYFWRVIVLGNAGEKLGESSISRFRFRRQRNLFAPESAVQVGPKSNTGAPR